MKRSDIIESINKVKKIQGSSNMRRFYTFDSKQELETYLEKEGPLNYETSTISWATRERILLVVWSF